MATATAKAQAVTLRGSTDTVVEFFEYSIYNILYQRAVYPPQDFSVVPKYGLQLLVSIDDGLKAYLADVLKQLRGATFVCYITYSSLVCGMQTGSGSRLWSAWCL